MQKRNLVTAAVAVGVLVLLVAVFGRQERASTQVGVEAGLWLPGLQAALGEVDRVRVRSGERQATLVKTADGWGLEERGGYAVDFTRLGDLLRELAEARRVEQKTSKPEHFARLGLEDADKPDSKSMLVEIWRGGEQPAWRVIVGNAAQGRSGRYVRMAEGTETWLVDRSPQAFADPADWLDRALIGVGFERVARLQRTLADGTGFTAARATREQSSLAGEDIPAGKKPRYETVFDAAARAVLSAELEDVRKAGEAGFDGADAKPVRNTVSTFDGLVLEIDALKGQDGNWIRVTARAGEVLAPPPQPATEAATADAPVKTEAGTGTASAGSAPTDPAQALADEVAALNARLGGWAYKVSDYVFGELAKAQGDYIEDDTPASEPAAADTASAPDE